MPPGSPSHQPPSPPPPAGPSGSSWSFWIIPSATTTTTTSTFIHQSRKPSISLTPADLEMDEDMAPDEQVQLSDDEDIRRPAYEIVKVFHPDVIHLQYQMEECHKLLTDSVDDPILRHNVRKPLPLGGPPSQVTIQSDFFFNKYLEYLRYGSKGRRLALSISKMKAAYYPDAGLEQMVPDQFWIDEECKYDIAAMYGISHWWFQRQQFYIDRHTSEEDFQLGIESYQTQLNLTKPQWDATGFEYKHDYTIIDSPSAIIFQDKYRVQMMMHFNEIHKFSDGTLQQIDEALDYRVKEFRINMMNPEAVEDKADLLQPGELCWWTHQRGRLQNFEVYRMIKSFRHSRPLPDDL
nr:hypothetical protein [Tanacetum cinerariifolium]